MQPDEVSGLGALAGLAACGICNQVRDTHTAIARRVFGSLGPGAAAVRVLHDRASDTAYGGVRALTAAMFAGGASAAGLAQSRDQRSMQESVSGRLVVGALNGVWGDALERRGNALATPMTVRARGRDLPSDRERLREVLPAAGSRLAIFLHGLCETDDAWRLGADRHPPYGDRLESELGYTSVYVRYNSGLHVSQNGRRLAGLLDELVDAWPVDLGEIALIGHSMGGLVARSACHYGRADGWRARVRHVFTLGAPHRGAALERAANVACSALSMLPETRGIARPLKARSAGIKDLRYGYLIDEDWLDRDPDAFLRNTGSEIPFLDCANHYFVCATVLADPDAPLSRIVGDLLVQRPSAWANARRGERIRFAIDHYHHLGSATHFELLNHPAIYGQIKHWLTADRARPAA